MRRGLALAILLVVVAAAGPAAAHAGPRLIRDWPCQGCLVVLPPKLTPHAPLLVALHGDEGDPALTASLWGPVTAARGAVLLAPKCPAEAGCAGSWWAWFQSGSSYDDGWIGRQTQAVEHRFRVDPRREYLEGWSGGADFLGWYAARHAGRFAGAAFVAGGVPYTSACPARALPAFFLAGDHDFRTASGQPEQVRSLLARCGSPTAEIVALDADHQGTIMSLQTQAYAGRILGWLLRYRR